MSEKNTSTHSSTHIEYVCFDEAIRVLKEMEKNKPNEQDIYKMIATLGEMINSKTMTSKYIPKGIIMIGTGDDLDSYLSTPPPPPLERE